MRIDTHHQLLPPVSVLRSLPHLFDTRFKTVLTHRIAALEEENAALKGSVR